MSELIIHSGKLQGRRVILPEREVSVGRDEACHMRIASSLVSRKHCLLKATPEGIWVKDLQSQNGTYVNDVAITEAYLMKPGDLLRIGASVFQVPYAKTSPHHASGDKGGGTGKTSEDDISNWLSDDEQTTTAGIPETAIIKGRQSTSPDPGSAPTPPTEVPTAESPMPSTRGPSNVGQTPRSVKDQAAEIIRRHWETVRAKNQ